VRSALLGSAAGQLDAASASRPADVSVRAVLLNYAGGVLAPLLGLVALLAG
jgi:hypothetical protein